MWIFILYHIIKTVEVEVEKAKLFEWIFYLILDFYT